MSPSPPLSLIPSSLSSTINSPVILATIQPASNATIALGFDLALAGLFGIFVLAALPRSFSRLVNLFSTGDGVLLLSGGDKRIAAQESELSAMDSKAPSEYTTRTATQTLDPDAESARSSATRSDIISRTDAGFNISELSRQTTRTKTRKHRSCLPLRIPSWSNILYPVSAFFTLSVAPHVTIGKLCLLLLYYVGVIVASFLNSNPITDPNRVGFIAVAQIPILVALATKNNIPGLLVALSYEKINYMHRWAGVVVAILADLHSLSYIFQWVRDGTLQAELAVPSNAWGLVALIAIQLLSILSISFIRERLYGLFYFSHLIGFVVLMIGIAYHASPTVRYLQVAAIILALDIILRLLRTRLCTALIRPMPELLSTHIEIPALTHGWRAGQHVKLRIVTRSLRVLATSHPFTIGSAGGSESGHGLTLICKDVGGWTKGLYDVACLSSGRKERFSLHEVGARRMMVLVEGPYGGLGSIIPAASSAVVIICGGSGVTFGFSVVDELLQDVAERAARTRIIEFIWIIQNRSSLPILLSRIRSIIDNSSLIRGLEVKISVHYTAAVRSSTNSFNGRRISEFTVPLQPTLQVIPGRPDFTDIFSSVIDRTVDLQNPRGVAVAVCGPYGLTEDVQKAVWSIDSVGRNAVGGIDLHVETFDC